MFIWPYVFDRNKRLNSLNLNEMWGKTVNGFVLKGVLWIFQNHFCLQKLVNKKNNSNDCFRQTQQSMQEKLNVGDYQATIHGSLSAKATDTIKLMEWHMTLDITILAYFYPTNNSDF